MSALPVLLGRLPYVVAVLLVGIGLVTVIDEQHLVRKVVGLNLFQTGIFLFFVAAAFRRGGRSPNVARPGPYVDPVPQVLVLTAIVVGVSVTAVALALVVRIYRTYGSLREETVRDAMAREAGAETRDGGDAGGAGGHAPHGTASGPSDGLDASDGPSSTESEVDR
jgi:multicomponent Na+:H+ antiporter subunit C